MLNSLDLRSRALAASVHLLISAAVSAIAAALVFGLWFPGPFRWLAGGQGLFLLVISVDVVLGPCLTFAVFNTTKTRIHLRRDLAVIGAIQLAGIAYGLHTVYETRPIAMVFEVDRMRLVTAIDVDREELPKALPAYRDLPIAGPWLLGTRRPKPGAEHNDALDQGLAGNDISSRPIFWQPYEQSVSDILAKSRPLTLLLARYPTEALELHWLLLNMHADESTSRFLPAQARGAGSAVLDETGHLLGYLPVDGFV